MYESLEIDSNAIANSESNPREDHAKAPLLHEQDEKACLQSLLTLHLKSSPPKKSSPTHFKNWV